MEASEPAGVFVSLLLAVIMLNLFRAGYCMAGMLLCRHPVFLGLLAWVLTGNTNLVLAALFFELFWLDLFNAGTYIPPDSVFAYLVFAPSAVIFGLNTPVSMTVMLLCCLPLAGLSAKVDQHLRRKQSVDYHALNTVINEVRDITACVTKAAHKTLVRGVIVLNVMYALCVLYLWGLMSLSVHLFGKIYEIHWMNWYALFCFGAVGGLLSLRIPQAMVCFIACASVVGGIFIFGFN